MTIPPDVLLVMMDVTSLHTNIPNVDGEDACSKFLNDHCVADVSTDVLCSLTSFTVTHNNFVFDDHSYLQTSGTAMGTKMAPCFANIFMASIEQTFIDNLPLTPLFYVQFINDIFMIWAHGNEELEQFTTRANSSSTHPSIKFTTEISSTSLPFLDVLKYIYVLVKQKSKIRTFSFCYYNFYYEKYLQHVILAVSEFPISISNYAL